MHPSFILQHVSPELVLKLLSGISTNAQGIDGLNIKMISYCIPYCIHALTHIINFSISANVFPDLWKKAYIRPIPKISSPSVLKDYRPISLLPTVSKVLEKVVALQMYSYLCDHNLWNPVQSGFRKNHSTASALLKVSTDIVNFIEAGDVTVLTLLDYSKAFDMVNHQLLLAKLSFLGFMESTTEWFRSYLGNRSQLIFDKQPLSEWIHINNGVPQGSILGPLLFIIMSHDISSCVSASHLHLYADDTQVYKNSSPSNLNFAIAAHNNDLNNINNWSRRNCLKLNGSKCVSVIIGSRHNINKLDLSSLPPVMVDGVLVPYVTHCRNLGLIFDQHLTWEHHITSVVSKAYFKLRCLTPFKHLLSTNIKLRLCDALILSNFSYCDIVYCNLSTTLLNKLQRVQNACLRFSFCIRKFDHITPLFRKANWLNMRNRQTLHCLCFLYRIFNGDAPLYLNNLLPPVSQHQYFTRNIGHVPQLFRYTIKGNSFFVKFVRIYDDLPGNIKCCNSLTSFKYKLKCRLLSEQLFS